MDGGAVKRVTDAELAALPEAVRVYLFALEKENGELHAEVKRLGRENDELCDENYALKQKGAA